VELHEVWLRKDSRGRSFGSAFFDYFESMVREMGYRHIVYYADHPAALAICRARGYREGWRGAGRDPWRGRALLRAR
jgi:GNAT superfamily N-acetyltransferase